MCSDVLIIKPMVSGYFIRENPRESHHSYTSRGHPIRVRLAILDNINATQLGDTLCPNSYLVMEDDHLNPITPRSEQTVSHDPGPIGLIKCTMPTMVWFLIPCMLLPLSLSDVIGQQAMPGISCRGVRSMYI